MHITTLIDKSLTAYESKLEQKVKPAPKTHYGYFRAATTGIAEAVLAAIPFINSSEFRIFKHEYIVGFASEELALVQSAIDYIEGVIKQSNRILLNDIKVGWLPDYLARKDLFGSFSQMGAYRFTSDESAKTHYDEQVQNRKADKAYIDSKKQMQATIIERSYDEEFQYIIDYICSEFEGHEGKDIANKLQQIQDFLRLDISTNAYTLAKKDTAHDERYAIYALLRHLSETDESIAYYDIIGYSPEKDAEITLPDTHRHWEKMRREVKKMLDKTLPNLIPKSLDALLKDEDAVIPETIAFKGVNLEGLGSFGFAKRVHPSSLRYDQQEQGNSWKNVVAGAIVAHFHMYLEAKQGDFIRYEMFKLADMLIKNPKINIKSQLSGFYKQASSILQ
jgi:hypothetical protein